MDELSILTSYLSEAREALLWKVTGLDEYAARTPLTGTGLSLAGLLLHTANCEIGYLGTVFGRPWPHEDPLLLIADETFETDPQADFIVPAQVSLPELLDFVDRVHRFADATIADLSASPEGLGSIGVVPWWGGQQITLRRAIAHQTSDLTRHAGQADILREQLDGTVGLASGNENLPDLDWSAHRQRVQQIADLFAGDRI